MNTAHKQPWLQNAGFDSIYILLPGLLALLVTLLLPAEYKSSSDMPLAGWIILVLLIDVAHVYSTLFRTYWDKQRFEEHKILFLAVPVVCYVAGVLLYSINGLLFWRVLAYLAVFHFIRQQYGFMRLYSRFEPRKTWYRHIDTIAIYTATLYPIIYWHCTPGRNFSWFIDGDFIIADLHWLKELAFILYCLVIAAYCIKEIIFSIQTKTFNIPRNTIVFSTFISWYFGIVFFNGDMAFTLLNVVSHGIPYMALVWLFRKKEDRQNNIAGTYRNTVLFFIASIIVFAFLEEGLWDGLVWRERTQLFNIFSTLPAVTNKELLALLIPLLSLPQSTHYILDGFIWRKKG